MTGPARDIALPADSRDAADELDAGRAARGDGDAFTRLIERHQAAVARWMWRFTRDRDEHAELVQEVFVAAWESFGSYRGDGRFGGWLQRIAVRTGYDLWRRRRRERVEFEPDVAAVADRVTHDPSPAAAVEAAETVHALLARLAPRDRLVLTLLHLDGLTVDEIAAVTGWSRSMVKVQAWRARGKLRRLLEAGEPA
ncbi:MAG: sigma-70 family RNA polymerase sigma factor [Armatimonadetes bacterium]|nr:sigma-70 family RNA polymerase sigma factor [Armatimonadota bacterium]